MRAADDFAVIRARTGKLETQRQWAAHKREQTARDEAASSSTASTIP